MKGELKITGALLLVGLAAAIFMFWVFQKDRQPVEARVNVIQIELSGNGTCSIPGEAVGKEKDGNAPFVARLMHFRAERLPVVIVSESSSDFLIRCEDLKPGNFLILQPHAVNSGEFVTLLAGLDDEKSIRLTIEAGMAAVKDEDLENSMRFISAFYSDDLGFDFHLMRALLKRAYGKFDGLQLVLAGSPAIKLEKDHAEIQTEAWLSAVYSSRRNYLLGERDSPNKIQLQMDKFQDGWKITRISGLKPLGFDERFLRFLGADLGLAISEKERVKKQQNCMPCRLKMQERFGPIL